MHLFYPNITRHPHTNTTRLFSFALARLLFLLLTLVIASDTPAHNTTTSCFCWLLFLLLALAVASDTSTHQYNHFHFFAVAVVLLLLSLLLLPPFFFASHTPTATQHHCFLHCSSAVVADVGVALNTWSSKHPAPLNICLCAVTESIAIQCFCLKNRCFCPLYARSLKNHAHQCFQWV